MASDKKIDNYVVCKLNSQFYLLINKKKKVYL